MCMAWIHNDDTKNIVNFYGGVCMNWIRFNC